jgi:hypothetical protein
MNKKPYQLEECIALYVSGMPMLGVCAQTGISLSTLQTNLKKRGLSRSNKINSRKYLVNHEYFTTIDTPDKAYWLGFYYADGFITRYREQNKYVGVTLKSTDIDHLEKLKLSMSCTYPIKTYKGKTSYGEVTYSRLIVTSDQMFNDLIKLGVVERKSTILTYPPFDIVPENLEWHFIRGYFDGDGSFSKATKGYMLKVCGTWEFLTKFAERVGKPDLKLGQRRKGKNSWSLDIGGRLQVQRIADSMYKDASVWLDRKRALYESFILNWNHSTP